MRNSNQGKYTPYVRPIQRIELSEANVKGRLIMIVVLLALAVVAIATGMMSVLRPELGWNQIEAQAKGLNCSQEFSFHYDFTDAGSDASAQKKALTALYSAACEDAFYIFNADLSAESFTNVCDLNQHPNETVTVHPVLYQAFELIRQHQNRSLSLAPVYGEYNRIFMASNEVEAAEADPRQNPELPADLAHLAGFANDPAMIDLQLLGNNQVRLQVAQEYLDYAREYELERLIDFGWMKNAFITDYLAQTLIDSGFTSGYLVSFDGFTRNLDTRSNRYSVNLFNRVEQDIYLPAVLSYTAPQTIVFLRDFPLTQVDNVHYYPFPGGRIATMLIDPADGLDKAAVDSLLSYSSSQSCAELLLQLAPLFIRDEFHPEDLLALAEQGTHSIWFEDFVLRYTDPAADIALQPQEDVAYSKDFAG